MFLDVENKYSHGGQNQQPLLSMQKIIVELSTLLLAPSDWKLILLLNDVHIKC